MVLEEAAQDCGTAVVLPVGVAFDLRKIFAYISGCLKRVTRWSLLFP